MKEVFIDESGNLGKGERFFVIAVVCFDSDTDYKKWKRVAKKFIKKEDCLRNAGEIKSFSMDYSLKKKVFEQIEKRNIGFRVWIGVIDTNHAHYRERFILQDNSKELAFNYTLKRLFEELIAKEVQEEVINIYVDQRNTKTGSRYSLREYLNAEFLHDPTIPLQRTFLYYQDSKNNYGIQLSDLIANIVYTKLEYNKSSYLFEKYVKSKLLGKCEYPEC